MIKFLSRMESNWLMLGDDFKFIFEKWLHKIYNLNLDLINLERFKSDLQLKISRILTFHFEYYTGYIYSLSKLCYNHRESEVRYQ